MNVFCKVVLIVPEPNSALIYMVSPQVFCIYYLNSIHVFDSKKLMYNI